MIVPIKAINKNGTANAARVSRGKEFDVWDGLSQTEPKRNKDEEAKNFVNRCMSSDVMKEEYPSQQQRIAVCVNQSRAASTTEGLAAASEELIYENIKKEIQDEI